MPTHCVIAVVRVDEVTERYRGDEVSESARHEIDSKTCEHESVWKDESVMHRWSPSSGRCYGHWPEMIPLCHETMNARVNALRYGAEAREHGRRLSVQPRGRLEEMSSADGSRAILG